MRSTNPTQALFECLYQWRRNSTDPFPWGVGYSGGRDSGVLLWALVQVVGPGNLRALYVDHGWRPESERTREKSVVSDWCGTLGVELISYPAPVGGTSTEAQARAHRYSCYRKFLNRFPKSPVLLAHHAEDQAETVLMRILRGRSWQGLGGMAQRRGPFVRPLLALDGEIIKQVAVVAKIPYHEDSTNSDHQLLRNYLRIEVMPVLKSRFPRASEALNDLASVWTQAVPPATVAAAWTLGIRGGRVDTGHWDRWTELERQVQLIAVASKIAPRVRLSRRFLEIVSGERRSSPLEGAGWSWRRISDAVIWERVVQTSPKEYFIVSGPRTEFDLQSYRFSWDSQLVQGITGSLVTLEGVDPGKPVVWRSAVPGMRFASSDDDDWGKEKRRKRLGAVGAEGWAYVFQDSILKAVLDPLSGRVVWSESSLGKLNNNRIFVKLVLRSDYERR